MSFVLTSLMEGVGWMLFEGRKIVPASAYKSFFVGRMTVSIIWDVLTEQGVSNQLMGHVKQWNRVVDALGAWMAAISSI